MALLVRSNFQSLRTPVPLTASVLAILALAMACARMRPAVAPGEPGMLQLVPAPASVMSAGERFAITAATKIFITPADADTTRIAGYLADLIAISPQPRTTVESAAGSVPDGHIQLRIDPAVAKPAAGRAGASNPEGYELTIGARGVTLTAAGPAGLFYGVQTIRHLLPYALEYEALLPRPVSLPAGRITDAPRFAWRGAMLDVSRHFFDVTEVKRYIDLISMLKMNRLHLHLADDQGWRIEIRSWPNLTKHGGSTEVGGGPGGFYTQDQYRDIVNYAAQRFITIVPEIDMPGHTNAALASYPELNCDGVAPPLYSGIEVGFSTLCVDKEITYKFIDEVVREIGEMTPGPYFHIGGDEVKKLTDEQYRRFIERVQAIVQKHGKQVIGWDEIAPAQLLPTTIVQHWRPKALPREAITKKATLILSPAHKTYLDMKYDKSTAIGLDWAAVIEVRDAYDWDPSSILEGVAEDSVLGIEAPIWSETLGNIRDVEFLAFPRIAAIAEIAWSPRDRRNWGDFRTRLGAQSRRWTAMGINFYRSPQVPWQH